MTLGTHLQAVQDAIRHFGECTLKFQRRRRTHLADMLNIFSCLPSILD